MTLDARAVELAGSQQNSRFAAFLGVICKHLTPKVISPIQSDYETW